MVSPLSPAEAKIALAASFRYRLCLCALLDARPVPHLREVGDGVKQRLPQGASERGLLAPRQDECPFQVRILQALKCALYTGSPRSKSAVGSGTERSASDRGGTNCRRLQRVPEPRG
jgi:hypothetical protein